jgi:hypothetical protein
MMNNGMPPNQPQVMLNLSAMGGKPKYIATIRQANNGFAVMVEQDAALNKPMTEEEAQRRLGKFMEGLNERMERSSDSVMAKIYNKAEEEKAKEEEAFIPLGLNVFPTFSELTAFLSFVYEENEKAKTS